jgi:hypothetical protein
LMSLKLSFRMAYISQKMGFEGLRMNKKSRIQRLETLIRVPARFVRKYTLKNYAMAGNSYR